MSYLKKIIIFLIRRYHSQYADTRLGDSVIINSFVFQKIFRINNHVSWPVHFTSVFKCVGKFDRGNRFPGLSPGGYFDARNGIVLGSEVRVGPHVKLISMNHDVTNYETYKDNEPIKIGDYCWLGAGVTVLPGVTLAEHIVCGAGSVVTKSFHEKNILIAGCPAKKVKNIGPIIESTKINK